MKIVVAPNAFKGSLTASQAAGCMARGLLRALPDCSIVQVPVADGGDGTARTIAEVTGGRWVPCQARDPLGRTLSSGFGVTGDGRTAVVEMALASGVALLKPRERDPSLTGTWGTGDLIRAALDLDVSHLLLGIGGSATTDGGMGMARALGIRFFDAQGAELGGTGADLAKVARIDVARRDPRLARVTVDVACDVDNPLYGPQGAAYVYGPQKGASPQAVEALDAGLRKFAAVMRRDLGVDVSTLAGGGAAGGLGAGVVAMLGGRLVPGAERVLALCGLPEKLAGSDWVFTGEGRLDGQTVSGKAPAVVARMAQKLGIPAIAIAGCLGPEVERVREAGICAYFSASEASVTEAELPVRGPGMLERCAEQVGRLLATARSLGVSSTEEEAL